MFPINYLIYGLILSIFSVGVAKAACTIPSNYINIKYRENFYRQTSSGTLSILPAANSSQSAIYQHRHITFPHSGTYSINQTEMNSPTWWFAVNHKASPHPPTYLGVFIIKFLRTSPYDSLELFRNSGWSDSLKTFHTTKHTYETFFSLQGPKSNLGDFQKAFGPWHARVTSTTNHAEEPDNVSWARKDFWANAPHTLENFQDMNLPVKNQLVEARLFKFTPTQKNDSKSPLLFFINTSDSDKIFIKTFSPASTDFSKEYCINIE